MPGPTQISVQNLARLIGTPDAPTLLDLRLPDDFALAPRLIPTSVRAGHDTIATRAPQLMGQRCVVLCQKGRKISEGAAALLRSKGIQTETLEGGFDAWAAAGHPLIPAPILHGTHRWVTRHRPKIDRIACPWLIRRFIAPNAEFLFVPPAEVAGVATYFDALPFDVEGVFWSHRQTATDAPSPLANTLCTFDVMLHEFALTTPALARMATVIRAADTDTHAQSPQAAGLLALSVGLSRMYKDDLQQLDAGMMLYDALYRWARDGVDEGHDWPAPPTKAAKPTKPTGRA
jgi:rhodanese-related sulfurtransferase